MTPGVRVFLNPGATHGTGRERWARVAPELSRRLGALEVEETRSPAETTRRIEELVGRGERRFVAAGGDGTVNLLVNALMAAANRAGDVVLGAVGLGSSNDLHKPYGDADTVDGMPVHVDFERARERDVIRIDGVGEDGTLSVRYSLVNAGIGITAEANARFNEPNVLVKAARRLSVDAAITAAVLSTLATWRDLTCALSTDGGGPAMTSVTNLGVYKNEHFGGSLCYDATVGRADGRLGVALCESMTALETVRTLSALRKGLFTGRPKTRTWSASTLSVSADRPFALETDGEVARVRRAEFAVAGRRLLCCA
jgi:diacylglycerol kinase (ATP)